MPARGFTALAILLPGLFAWLSGQASGHLVCDLRTEEFQVTEDGGEQRVVQFGHHAARGSSSRRRECARRRDTRSPMGSGSFESGEDEREPADSFREDPTALPR